MKAVGFDPSVAEGKTEGLTDLTIPTPTVRPRDLLVRVQAISVNPADTKVLAGSRGMAATTKILGYDAAGIVEAVGDEVKLFAPGDHVFYAGDITRQGTNAELHAVDERIVGHKPASLDWASAAALPLTSITAWEALFDRLDISRPVPGAHAILIVGGAGGVGSIAIQLVKTQTDLKIIATASGDESSQWVRSLGADYVIDHHYPLAGEFEKLGIPAPGFVFSTTHTDEHLPELVKLIAPQGRIGFIDDPVSLDIVSLKSKMISAHWEYMFGRSTYQTPDMREQHRILEMVSDLVDEKKIKSTLTEKLSPINAATLQKAHKLVLSGKAHGKVVIEGWT
jgi:NADPH:quinone reductase